MPSTFSSLKIELIATGEQSGTWGVTTNTNLGTAIEEAITGSADVTFTNGNDTTITLTDTNAAQAARNLRLNLIGSSTGAQNLILGSGCQIEKLYLINNTLGHAITVKNTTGTGIAVPAGKKAILYNNGTNVLNAVDYFATADIAGGTINNTVIGGTTPAAGTFTQVNIPAQGDLRLEDTTGGEYVALQAPGTLASSYTLTMPVDDGTNGQALITDGNGNLSWSTAPSGDVYGPASATDNAIARFDLTTGKIIQNSVVTIADTTGNMAGVGTLSSGAITSSSLTSGRVLYAGASGLIQDNADFTFNGTTVTMANDASISGLTVGKGGGASFYNTAVGAGVLAANTTGIINTAVGSTNGANATLSSNTTGNGNNAFGAAALGKNTTASQNNAFGYEALRENTTGANNVAVGGGALLVNTTASNNTAVGYQAGYSNTTGSLFTAIGYQAGYSYNHGATDVATLFCGSRAGYSQTSGLYNTYIGEAAGYNMTTGGKNTILGRYTGNQGGLDIRTASNYIVLSDGDGNPRGFFNSNAVFKASNANAWNNSADSVHEFYQSRNTRTLLCYNASTSYTSQNILSFVATASGTGYKFYSAQNSTAEVFFVRGDGNCYNTNGTYGTISDAKLKENIVDATPKLDKINQLKVRNFNLIGDNLKQIGFVAQEFEQVFPSMVDETPDLDKDGNALGTSTKAIKTTVLIPILVKAIQELKAEVDSLKAQLNNGA